MPGWKKMRSGRSTALGRSAMGHKVETMDAALVGP